MITSSVNPSTPSTLTTIEVLKLIVAAREAYQQYQRLRDQGQEASASLYQDLALQRARTAARFRERARGWRILPITPMLDED
jgi:hypothetical protein